VTEQRIRLHIPDEAATHLHERTCRTCGNVWTFTTERERLAPNTWSLATYFKLGRPTVPAVGEVLWNREDGWVNDSLFERQQFVEQLSRR
jgi:hypothetical protein